MVAKKKKFLIIFANFQLNEILWILAIFFLLHFFSCFFFFLFLSQLTLSHHYNNKFNSANQTIKDNFFSEIWTSVPFDSGKSG